MSDSGQGISQGGLYAVIWTLGGLATLLFGGRLIIRKIILSRFHGDDFFISLAWFLMILADVFLTVQTPLNYQYAAIILGETPAPPEDVFAPLVITIRKYNVAGATLFWTSLFCVKFSFMWLYRLVLGPGSRNLKFWYIASIYILVSWGITLIGVYGQCGDARNLFSFDQCQTPYVVQLLGRLLWTDYFFNITSDLIVIILPLPIIWTLRMRSSQKIAVSAVCSLALVTIAFDTVRTVKLYQEDSYLTNLYSYLELQIAVIIAMLPSYRFLISDLEKNREYRRLFLSRITFGSFPSNHSSYALHSADRGRQSPRRTEDEP